MILYISSVYLEGIIAQMLFHVFLYYYLKLTQTFLAPVGHISKSGQVSHLGFRAIH